MNIEIKDLPSYHVASIRAVGPYCMETSGPAWEKMMKWAEPKGIHKKSKSLGICWDNPEAVGPENCRYDACFVISPETEVADGIVTQEVPAGKYAVYTCQVMNNDFKKVWDEMMGWFFSNGHQMDERPAYEVYNSIGCGDAEGKWDLEICVPVKA